MVKIYLWPHLAVKGLSETSLVDFFGIVQFSLDFLYEFTLATVRSKWIIVMTVWSGGGGRGRVVTCKRFNDKQDFPSQEHLLR